MSRAPASGVFCNLRLRLFHPRAEPQLGSSSCWPYSSPGPFLEPLSRVGIQGRQPEPDAGLCAARPAFSAMASGPGLRPLLLLLLLLSPSPAPRPRSRHRGSDPVNPGENPRRDDRRWADVSAGLGRGGGSRLASLPQVSGLPRRLNHTMPRPELGCPATPPLHFGSLTANF